MTVIDNHSPVVAEEPPAADEFVATPESGSPGDAPTPAAVTFVTTEHFTLQGARAAMIAQRAG